MYAYVHRDCYGDEQDHICAAVRSNGELILIDATLPYRKWHGFNCRHQEYELLSPTEFEERMKKEEAHWTDVADRFGNKLYAGLLYAPWIHERIVSRTDSIIESIFYLLLLNNNRVPTLYAYYMKYTSERGTLPMMSAITEGKQTFYLGQRTVERKLCQRKHPARVPDEGIARVPAVHIRGLIQNRREV